MTVTGCVVSGNAVTAGIGGGAYGDGALQLTNCVVSGNTSTGDGGGLYTTSSGAVVSGGTIEQNESGGYGGAWYVSGGSPLLQSCQVRNNVATTVGGVWVQSGSLRVSSTSFCGNGVNVNGPWQDLGGNSFQGGCDGGGPVTRRVPEQYSTIGAAIESSYDGDVVEVGPGTYAEGLNLGGREITVRSTAGASQTVVDLSLIHI